MRSVQIPQGNHRLMRSVQIPQKNHISMRSLPTQENFLVTTSNQIWYTHFQPIDKLSYPGNIYYDPKNVTLLNDILKLSMTNDGPNSSWCGAEAVLCEPCTYGEYYVVVKIPTGAKAFLDDYNTTIGIFTFKADNTPTPGLGSCYPNTCHEIDIVEYGKGRNSQEQSAGQWGIQPWYGCASDPNNPNPDCDPDCISDGQVVSSRIKRWPNFTEEQWQAILYADSTITYKMIWKGPREPIYYALQPGHSPGKPWDMFSGQTPMLSFTLDPKENWAVPETDMNTYLHVNLWCQEKPSDNQPKTILVWDVFTPQDLYINYSSNPQTNILYDDYGGYLTKKALIDINYDHASVKYMIQKYKWSDASYIYYGIYVVVLELTDPQGQNPVMVTFVYKGFFKEGPVEADPSFTLLPPDLYGNLCVNCPATSKLYCCGSQDQNQYMTCLQGKNCCTK
jgi:hypothetical protein